MSGFFGIVHTDGAPVDERLAGRMLASLHRIGPDAQYVHTFGPTVLGHALLRTTTESLHEHQPLSFDERTWIFGDVRIDARDDLARELRNHDPRADTSEPDITLVLRA